MIYCRCPACIADEGHSGMPTPSSVLVTSPAPGGFAGLSPGWHTGFPVRFAG